MYYARPICLYHTAAGYIRKREGTVPKSVVARCEAGRMRKIGVSVFELPKPTRRAKTTSGGDTPVGPDVFATTYSVCTAPNGLRVAVVKGRDGKAFICSRGDCKK